MRDVAVLGVGMHPFGKFADQSVTELCRVATEAALRDAGLKFVNALKSREDLRRKYEAAKERAHLLEPSDPERYNQAKKQVIDEIYEEIDSRT